MSVHEMTAADAIEALRVSLEEARDELAKMDDKIAQIQADRRYWQGRKDSVVEAISVIEKGVER